MSIRLVALDLDGTLLDSQKNLPERNRKVLEECIARGIYIVPCTGRTAYGIPESVMSIPGIRYAITVNGGMIEDIQEHRILDTRFLDVSIALEIMEMVQEYHVMYDAYVEGHGVVESRFLNHMDDYKIPPAIQELVRSTRQVVPDTMEYLARRKGTVQKVNLFFSDLDERKAVRQMLMKRDDILVSSAISNNLEINAIGAAKGEALMRLASLLGLKKDETMACGDGENDHSMIQMAGIGVVMDNGEPSLKAVADYITASNDESGVAQAIEKLVLL